jgi:GT2 family glycosyltransferase
VNSCDVIVVNFNAGGFLAAAVESVLRSQSAAHIYIVDNASTDESLDLLPEGHNDRLTIIRNTANLGFAAACNLGLKRATSENMLLLNPDCSVLEGAVERLISALRSADRVGMVGPLLLNADGSEQPGGRRKLPRPSIAIARAAGAVGLRRLLARTISPRCDSRSTISASTTTRRLRPTRAEGWTPSNFRRDSARRS